MNAGTASLHQTGTMTRKREETAAASVSYSTLLWLFVIGSAVGFVLEGLWCVLRTGRWESHSATIWGPFCIIYGVGAVAVYLLSAFLKNRGVLLQFAVFTVSGAAVEYFGSLIQEIVLGSVSWDYSDHALNIGGRVSLQMALLWGVLGILFMRLLFPLLSRLFAKMRGKGWRVACVCVSVFMAVNLLVTAAAVTRWRSRTEGAAPASAAAQWLDAAYDDRTMAALFPNMTFTAE